MTEIITYVTTNWLMCLVTCACAVLSILMFIVAAFENPL